MGIMRDLLDATSLPKMARIMQKFDSTEMGDVESAVRQEFFKLGVGDRIKDGMSIAVGVGSRGMDKVDVITRAVVEEINKRGAKPFIIPAMGSHGGATAEGQREVLAALGITEDSIKCPIQSSMDAIKMGEAAIEGLSEPVPIYMDRHACHADGIITIARVKPHNCFRAPIESGMCKMLAIGFGKQHGANSCHQHTYKYMYDLIKKIAEIKIEKCKILFAIATIENAYDRVFSLTAVPAENIVEKDIELLELAKSKIACLMFDPIDALIVRRFGKDISGGGMDPNVVGRALSEYFPIIKPKINKIAVLDLSEATHGNAAGIGAADVITKRLYDKIDYRSTYANAITTTGLSIARVPMTVENDKEACLAAIGACNPIRSDQPRVVMITDSLHVGEIYISESLLQEARANPDIEILSELEEIPFDEEENLSFPF